MKGVKYTVGRYETIELARLFFGFGEPGKKFLEAFRGSLQKADPSVQMRGNEHELRVLAGSALVDTIERGERPLADLSALSLVAGPMQNAVAIAGAEIAEKLRRDTSPRGGASVNHRAIALWKNSIRNCLIRLQRNALQTRRQIWSRLRKIWC